MSDAQAARRQHDRNLLLVAAVALVLLVVGGGVGVQAWRTHRAPAVTGSVVPVRDGPQTIVDGQPLRFGADAATSTVTLYEDFHCPHCADFEAELGPTLTAAQNAGTARLEVYPMSFIDEGSTAAANAVACATEAGFGARYYLGLFANHTLGWSDSQLTALAGTVGGTPTAAFSTCVSARARAGWVTSVNAAADQKGVTSTPTMFFNGAPVALEGLTPARLQAMIDSGSAE